MKKLFVYLFSILIATSGYASDKECELEPKTCSLSGSLEIQSFPGSPNYQNVKKGDEDERGLYLRLDHPIMVHFEEDGKMKSESTSLVHLTGKIKDKHFKQARSKNHVIASGTLFEWFNGHHHTHFLMDVNKFVESKK